MDLTNYIFVAVLAFVFVSGIFLMYANMHEQYGFSSPTIEHNLNQTLINQQFYYMNETASSAFSAAVPSSTSPQDAIAALWGYVAGGINALILLASIPSIVLKLINAMMMAGGVFIPTFFVHAMIVAVYGTALIGLLYFLLKVK